MPSAFVYCPLNDLVSLQTQKELHVASICGTGFWNLEGVINPLLSIFVSHFSADFRRVPWILIHQLEAAFKLLKSLVFSGNQTLQLNQNESTASHLKSTRFRFQKAVPYFKNKFHQSLSRGKPVSEEIYEASKI